MCTVCPLVLYYEKLAKTTQNILFGTLDLIRRIIFAFFTCIFVTIRLFWRLYKRLGSYFANKYGNACPNKTDCKLQLYNIMCSISCLLMIVVAIFIVIFHTKWMDNLIKNCENQSAGTKNEMDDSGAENNGTEKNEMEQNGLDSKSNETNTVKQDVPEFSPATEETITEKSNFQRIGHNTDDKFNEIHDTTTNVYVDTQINNLSDFKELVKEKQSMSKVLSLLEEILTNMSSKKKFDNLLLSNVISTSPLDDVSVDPSAEISKKTSDELYVESVDNTFVDRRDDTDKENML